jgi:predicted nuclease of predicted toxin-antitoxin system
VKLLIDVNLSPRWKQWLATNGFASLHWSDVGFGAAPDSEIMSYAVEHQLVVITRDLDFGKMLLERGAALPSVIQLRDEDVTPDTLGKELIESLREAATRLTTGAILTVSRKRSRLTLLPLLKTTER